MAVKSVSIPPFPAGRIQFYAKKAAKKTSSQKAESLTSKGIEACCREVCEEACRENRAEGEGKN